MPAQILIVLDLNFTLSHIYEVVEKSYSGKSFEASD